MSAESQPNIVWPLSAAERQLRYKAKLRSDPQKYEEYKKRKRQSYHAKKRLVKDLSQEEKAKIRAMWKIRKQNLRRSKNFTPFLEMPLPGSTMLAAQHEEPKLKQRKSFDAPGPSSAAVEEDDSDSEESCNTEVAVRVITEPLTGIQDPLANIYTNNQCRFCANITKNCTDATDKPYIENNKMTLTLNNLNLEIDFNINTRKVCLDCDRRILDMINFVKQVKDAQECLNASYDMELTETYVKIERESTPDDDEDTKDEIVDSITIEQTAFVKRNAFAHKKRKCDDDKPSSKQKKAKDSEVTHENTEFVTNIKKERIDDEDVIKGDDNNIHKDPYSEDTHKRKEDTGHDIKPSKLDVAFNTLPMSDEMKGDEFS